MTPWGNIVRLEPFLYDDHRSIRFYLYTRG